ncbi:MAG: heavy-metal-associated domain-containing protein [Clostridiales bacterium]|nr:heavy-metal-associated domain-containing protein [Clostridiales bacterium]
MTILKVADISCQACVNNISRTLEAEGIEFIISLEEKSVTVTDDQTAERVIAILDEIGFVAVK